jgi:hypothetical protein
LFLGASNSGYLPAAAKDSSRSPPLTSIILRYIVHQTKKRKKPNYLSFHRCIIISSKTIAMSNLSLRLETLPRLVGTDDQGIFNILASLVHPASRLQASEAAHVIVNLGYQSRERPSDFKPLLFEITMHIARQIPHTHPSQQKLVDLLKALNSTPSDVAEEWQWANIVADGSGELAETYRCEFHHTLPL